ncbi:MAG: FG-GAP-like repeat-containing protein [Chloroflexota bacterium]
MHALQMQRKVTIITLAVLALFAGFSGMSLMMSAEEAQAAAMQSLAQAVPRSTNGTPVLALTQTISEEPLLGGTVQYELTVANNGATRLTDKGYNLTITNTLPSGLTFISASPSPTFISTEDDGSTSLIWDNIADLEVTEELGISIYAQLDSGLTVADTFINESGAQVNSVPDNSGTWIQVFSDLATNAQPVDIEMKAIQSTADEQATGAGEYQSISPGQDGGADWPYEYQVTVRNNNVGSSDDVVATVVLPPGVAYMGGVNFSTNPNGVSTTPALTLNDDGSLTLAWVLGQLTTAQYVTPIIIDFDVAIPYAYRTSDDTAAESGPFAGPMSGSIIPEDAVMAVTYEATATYQGAPGNDGTDSTPADDEPVRVTAEYLTVSKGASPNVVGIGSTVDYTINYYVSEYYTLTNVVLEDVLPDGTTYVDGSASLEPVSVITNTPGAGETTIIWHIDPANTTPGSSGSVAFQATVDATYERAPYAGQPVVSGDSLTNRVTISDDWADDVADDLGGEFGHSRTGTVTPDTSYATVTTRMPTFSKQVRDPITGNWRQVADGFVGDTVTFRLRYDSAADVDAKGIVIRDFLPRGMTYVNGSASHTVSGNYSSGSGCTSTPQSPTTGMLNGLQYVEWSLCNAEQGASWEVTLDALVGPKPDVQPGWIVANFGKLSGHNTYDENYSLRDIATTNYKAPLLVLTKSASPNRNLEAGDTVNYSIVVENTGDATAYNLDLIDTVPADLIIANSGGSASSDSSGGGSSSYITQSGDPQSGSGGVLQWSTVASLAPGESLTYSYQATIPNGLVAGQSMLNIASVDYNSRADDQGHQEDATSNVEDPNTDDEEVFTLGATVTKTDDRDFAMIGDTVHWTITGNVPAGQIAYWPVVEENNLPNGFDYVPGSTVVTGATLDNANHATNPFDNGNVDLRWFLETIDNRANDTDYQFTIEFDALLTGVQGNNTSNVYYTNNQAIARSNNTAYIGWYDDATGYNGQGFAYDGLTNNNRVDRRSPRARHRIEIRQPYVSIQKAVSQANVEAGDIILYTLTMASVGTSDAYDVELDDVLPAGITYLDTVSIETTIPEYLLEFGVSVNVTDNSVAGSNALNFDVDVMYPGVAVQIIYRAQVAASISADLTLENVATVTEFSSKPGTPPDSNGDGLNDERVYTGPSANATVQTPAAEIQKAQEIDDELVHGRSMVYRITVPAQPVNATMYNVVVNDTINEHLSVSSVSNGAVSNTGNGNQVTANFASIAPNQQEVIAVTVLLPANSAALPGDSISNQASMTYDNGGTKDSNVVVNTVVGSALVVDKIASTDIITTGDTLAYTITVSNVGNGRAENLVLSDVLPTNMSYVANSATVNGDSLSDPTAGSVALPTLEPGTSHVIVFQATANTVVGGELYTNVASATGTNSNGDTIPADTSTYFPADTDADDSDDAVVSGPLVSHILQAFVAYEDLKLAGWCDWDYNDFVVRIDTDSKVTASGGIAELEFSYKALSRGAGYNHRFHHQMPLQGGGYYYLTVYTSGSEIVRQEEGAFTDANFTIFMYTRDALPVPPGYETFTNTLDDQTNLTSGYTADLRIVMNDRNANQLVDPINPYRVGATLDDKGRTRDMPWDPYIYVYDTGEEVHLVQPGHMDNTQMVDNTYEPGNPMLGQDLEMAFVFDPEWHWTEEFIGIWNGYPRYVNHMTTGRAQFTDWFSMGNGVSDLLWLFGQRGDGFTGPFMAASNNPDFNIFAEIVGTSTSSRYVADPVVGDLQNNGTLAIVIGNLVAEKLEVYDITGTMMPNWPQAVNGGIKAGAVLVDLDADSDLEILVGSEGKSEGDTVVHGALYAFNADGSLVEGWPVTMQGNVDHARILSTPAVADLDGNGKADMIIVSLNDGRLHAFNADGTVFNPDGGGAWPVSIGDEADKFGAQALNSSPAIADLDGDGDLEIVVGSQDNQVYAVELEGDNAGNQLWTFETEDSVVATPVIADIDPTVAGLETIIGSGDAGIFLLDKDGNQLWAKYTNNAIEGSALVADIDGDNLMEIIIGSRDQKVYALNHDGTTVAGEWPVATQSEVKSTATMGDVDGDGVDEIVIGSDDAHVYAFELDGTMVEEWPKETVGSVRGAAIAMNMDDDLEAEVVAGDLDGRLYFWGTATENKVYLPVVVR